ncbi:DUF3772 domain-containing protein [Pseudochelatococcus sp. G4_1912]|uniref:DUF3772 domain-containing protein n=1 Tax=Pseudochelatococcus sp. G4_1912 TaxID=3114288 RepID=UPI0039C74E23
MSVLGKNVSARAMMLRVCSMLMLLALVACGDPVVVGQDTAGKAPSVSKSSMAAKPSSPKVSSTQDNANGARPAPSTALNVVRAELETLEKALESNDLNEEQLLGMRERVGDASSQIRAVISDLAPRAAAISAQLAQLGPRPAEGAPPESETTARERDERSRNLAELQAGIGLAEAMLVQAGQISTSINDKRRLVLANELFANGPSLFSPGLWKEALSHVPEGLESGRKIFGGWLVAASQRARDGMALATSLAIAVWAGLHFFQRRFLPRLNRRSSNEANPERLRRVTKAMGVMLCATVPIIASMMTLFAGLDAEGLADGRMESVIVWLLVSAGFVFFMRALARAIFAPGLPQWRLFSLDDDTATWLYHTSVVLTVVMLAGQLLQVVVAAADVHLSLVSLVDGLAAFSVAAVMFWTLQGLRRRAKPIEDDFGPYVPSEPQLWSLARVVGWLATFAILAALLTGFIAFASFIVDQVIWVATIVGLFFLITTLIEEVAVETPKRNSRVSLVLQTSVGLRRRTLEQIGILFAGLTKLVFFAIGIMLILAPWGLESNDVVTSLKLLRAGFSIGDLRMSPVDILGAIFTFGITLFISRVIQRWLSTRFLPATSVDPGIRNSIATGVGYIGFFLAVGLACTQIGLSLDRVAIVAGALSVGIGFGLQSIVNNFVSGLILLWERPIKVGDWVVVGPDEGYVKRINVRATEIETFDRAAVIVPNSSLVSGTVKNWLHHDKLGRVIIAIGVNYAADPEVVRDLMLACAKEHAQVLDTPPPSVLLRGFEPTMLRFEMRCFIANIENRLSVTSDLNFAVLKALRQQDFVPVRPMVWEEWKFGASDGADAEGGFNHHHGQDDTGSAKS